MEIKSNFEQYFKVLCSELDESIIMKSRNLLGLKRINIIIHELARYIYLSFDSIISIVPLSRV